MKPRVVIVAASLDILGGQAVQASTLSNCLRADGYEVGFIAVNPPLPRWLRWIGHIPYLRTLVRQPLYLASLWGLRRFDVAHVFAAAYWSFLLAAAPALAVARVLGLRTVLHYHTGEADDHLTHWGRRVHPWLRMAHEIVVPSDYLREIFRKHGHDARVIPNVLELHRFPYHEALSGKRRLLSNRNLEAHYRVGDIIRAFAGIVRRFPDATLTVAGTGREEASLRAAAASIGGGGVRFVGRVEPCGAAGLYRGADIFVNASDIDNQPLSVLEAFASGVPVVSTGTGDIASLVRHGETGLIVPPHDPGALAAAVEELLADPHRAQSIARAAHRKAQNYQWSHVRSAWAEVYGDVS